MTRSVTDWVQDNMLNPAYFGIVLTEPMLLEELGSRFDVLGSSPRFANDWRWFKGLCGSGRDFNSHVLNEYRKELHNFFDHRIVLPQRDPLRNAEFETAARAVCETVERWESGEIDDSAVEFAVRRVLTGIDDLPAEWSVALDEFLDASCGTAPHTGSCCRDEAVHLAVRSRDDLPVVREAGLEGRLHFQDAGQFRPAAPRRAQIDSVPAGGIQCGQPHRSSRTETHWRNVAPSPSCSPSHPCSSHVRPCCPRMRKPAIEAKVNRSLPRVLGYRAGDIAKE